MMRTRCSSSVTLALHSSFRRSSQILSLGNKDTFGITSWTSTTRWLATSSSSNGVVSVAIVGSGPSGCYTAKYLRSALKKEGCFGKMHVLDRLPTPYGLVRSGVAPDHPEVKNVENEFASLFKGGEIEFKGNINVGQDVSLKELQSIYDIVVLAYGCESDRKLGIPGEDELEGVLSAREFVAWYNGHPDFGHIGEKVQKALGKSPETAQVVVVGQGNVALDCARILAKGGMNLVDTDIASDALDILQSGVKKTVVLGRRGHVQGAFTIKELRELTKLDKEGYDASFVVLKDELDMGMTPASEEELNGPSGRPKVRINKLLQETASSTDENTSQRQVTLRFLLNPVEFQISELDPSTLGAVLCERTKLEGPAGKQIAVGTGHFEIFPAQMALVSIGYKGLPLPGMEALDCFDSQRGIVRNEHGKVTDSKGATGSCGSLYVSGWLKRGPSGIIGTNIPDAKDTVATIMKDLKDERLGQDTSEDKDLDSLLQQRGVDVVDWSSYKKINASETDPKRKRSESQPREKITTVDGLLRAAVGNR